MNPQYVDTTTKMLRTAILSHHISLIIYYIQNILHKTSYKCYFYVVKIKNILSLQPLKRYHSSVGRAMD